VYAAFAKKRFLANAKHSGEWPELKPGTLRGRARASLRRVNEAILHGELTGDKAEKALDRAARKYRRELGRIQSGAFNASILIDTATLVGALSIGAKGNVVKRTDMGIEFGIGGPGRHDSKSGATVGEIAAAHNAGSDKLPQRKIIVQPDDATMSTIKRIAGMRLREAAQDT